MTLAKLSSLIETQLILIDVTPNKRKRQVITLMT